MSMSNNPTSACMELSKVWMSPIFAKIEAPIFLVRFSYCIIFQVDPLSTPMFRPHFLHELPLTHIQEKF